MEGKGLKIVIMCVLILGLVVEQIQVEGTCCPNTKAVHCFIGCPYGIPACAKRCGCKIVDYDTPCPPGYDNFNRNSEEANVSNYCKLGCTSSLCDTISTDVGSKEEKDAVEHCNNACSRFCTKDVEIAMVTA